jgi:hypothetical protein
MLNQKVIGYCNHCARKLSNAQDIGVMIVGASGQWCRRSECKQDAKRWLTEFLKQNPIEAKLLLTHE